MLHDEVLTVEIHLESMENLSAKNKTLEKRKKAIMMFEKLQKLYTEMVTRGTLGGTQYRNTVRKMANTEIPRRKSSKYRYRIF